MKRIGKWVLYAVLAAGLFYGGVLLSVRLGSDSPSDARPNLSTDGSTQVLPDRAAGPPPGYEPPAPEDTPCLQPEFVSRCIGRSTARIGLMRLAGLQEAYMRQTGGYTDDAARVGFQGDTGMELRMRADDDGWTARYRHVATGIGCAIWTTGVEEPFTTPGGGVPEAAGAVSCDDPLAVGR
jgi:hypothetical protein